MYEIRLLYNDNWILVARYRKPSQAKAKILSLIAHGHSEDQLQLIRRKIRA